ncbi:MAG: enolase C-terminal domain-like protein, partial [Actinomycetota bacterium]|nr:enolase C-terminal domain-like protein [Actinomycetota bacterium]
AYSQLVSYKHSETSLPELSNEVQAAISLAIWNLEASKKDESLVEHLGGGADCVKVNALLDGSSQRNLRKGLESYRASGLSVFKVKLGFRDDQERLQLLSEIVREDEKIRLDPNGSWSLQYAVTFLDRVRKLLGDRLEYVEDPVANLEDLKKLRSIVPVPIAVDELSSSMNDLEAVIVENLCEYIVVKPSLIGGIDQTLKISSFAAKDNIQTVISSTYDGPIALTGWCAVAANVAPETTHGLGTADFFTNAQMRELIPEAGKVYFNLGSD